MDKTSKEKLDEAIAREKEKVEREVKDHEEDLQDVVGGTASGSGAGTATGTAPAGTFEPAWKISYET